MKTLIKQITVILFLGLFPLTIGVGTSYGNQEKIDFPNPSEPGLLRIVSGEGDIAIEGYKGKDVIIEVDSSFGNASNHQEDEKAKGMKRISGSGLTITSVKEENAIVITRSIRDESDLFIKVPFNTSLQFGGSAARPSSRIMPPAPRALPLPPDGDAEKKIVSVISALSVLALIKRLSGPTPESSGYDVQSRPLLHPISRIETPRPLSIAEACGR